MRRRLAYWRWKLTPPYVAWCSAAWYWESRWGRFGYWFPVYQAGPRAGQCRGIGLHVRCGSWARSFLVLPC